MITAVLAVAVAWGLFYGRMPFYALCLLCLTIGVSFAILSRRHHSHSLDIDSFAQISRLKQVNPLLKFWTVVLLIVLSVGSSSPWVGLLLVFVMSALTIIGGQEKIRAYITLLALPLSFLLIGGLVLLFDVAPQSAGVISIPFFDLWLNITTDAQDLTALVIARAFGAISCMYFLSMTTPMSDLIGVLGRIHCPAIAIDLMYLIYRYIFILLSMHRSMRDSAQSRMGYRSLRSSLRTTGSLYSNLLARSYRQASQMYDAMESRCYDNNIRFLEHSAPMTGAHVAAAASLLACTLAFSMFWVFWG